MFKNGLMAEDKILVTGGGSGLGKEIARRFSGLGAEVWICGRRRSVLDETAAEITAETGRPVQAVSVDIGEPGSVEEMVSEIWQAGPLTGLVNNAAGNFVSRTEDLSARGFDAIARIVLHGTFYVTQEIGKRWIADGAAGSVVSIVTTWGRTGSPFVIPSAMSKAGIEAMTKSLAIEWARYGIRLTAIAPGVFPTEGATARLRPGDNPHEYERSVNPTGRLGDPAELANLATFLLARDCGWINGETVAIDGGHHLANGAYFTNYMDRTAEMWAEMRDRIRAQTAEDKKLRTTGG